MRQRVTRRRRQQTNPRFQSQYSRSESPKSSSWPARIGKILVLILVLIGIGVAGFWLLFARIEVSGDADIASDIIDRQQTVFLPTFDIKNLAADVRERHPAEVRDVSIRHEWWQRRLSVVIEPRSPALTLRTQGQNFVVDKEGVVIEANESGGEELPLLIDESSLPAEVGIRAIPAQLAEFTTALNDSGLKIERFRIIDTTSELHADLEEGYTARFATSRPLKLQLENLARVQRIARKKGDNINEYIDLRIPYKAYYR